MRPILFILLLLSPFALGAQIITTIAGTGIAGFSGDGAPATSAQIGYLGSIAMDKSGNLFLADCNNGRIRKVSAATGIISTVAGDGTAGFSGDGSLATAAKLSISSTGDIAVDATGNLYISDEFNFRIRKVTIASGIINTIAGQGIQHHYGDGGAASSASFGSVNHITIDGANNVYVNDSGCWIRKITPTGNITTIAGNGTLGFAGDGGQATAAQITCGTMACDSHGNIYFTDHFRIRKVDAITGVITTIAGNGTLVETDGVAAIASGIAPAYLVFNSSDELILSESGTGSNKVRKVNTAGIISTIAGTGISGYSGDGGDPILAKFSYPRGVAFDPLWNLYISDNNNKRIRKITYPVNAVNEIKYGESPISVYPNPTNDILHIDNLQSKSTYRLLSIVGSVAQQGQLKEGRNEMNIQSLPKGMYVVEVINPVTGVRVTNKIIKE